MKLRFLRPEASFKERFVRLFALIFAVFAIISILGAEFGHSPVSIVWHGQEVSGWKLHAASCIFVPLASAMLAALCAVDSHLTQKVKRYWRSRSEE